MIGNSGPPRIEEIPHALHPTSTTAQTKSSFGGRLLRLEVKIDTLSIQKSQLHNRSFSRRRRSNPDIFQNPEEMTEKQIIFVGVTADTVLLHASAYCPVNSTLSQETSNLGSCGENC